MKDFDYVEKRLANTIGDVPARVIRFREYGILNDEGALLIAPAKINGVKKSTINTDDDIIIGQDILVSMCTLAEVVNGEGYSTREKHIIDWCANYIHPYGFTNVYNRIAERQSFIQYHKNNEDTVVSENTEDHDDPMGALIAESMAKFDYDECLEAMDEACLRAGTFGVDDFVSDMNKVVNATRVYCALCAHYLDKNDSPAAT